MRQNIDSRIDQNHTLRGILQMPVTATFFSNHQTFEPAKKKKTIVCSAYQQVFLALSFSRSMLRFASPNNFHQAKQCYFQIFNIPNDIFPTKICHHHDPSVLACVHSKITKSSLVSHVGSTKIRTNANLTCFWTITVQRFQRAGRHSSLSQ